MEDAGEILIRVFENSGLRRQALPGVIPGYAFYDEERYLFALHIRQAHLLFYLRQPALLAKASLPADILSCERTLTFRENPRGEKIFKCLIRN